MRDIYRRTSYPGNQVVSRDLNLWRQPEVEVSLSRERRQFNSTPAFARENCDAQIAHNGYCRVAEKKVGS